MLDDQEQQTLAGIEQDLAAHDPGLATRLRRHRAPVGARLGPAVSLVAVLGAVALMALGLVGHGLLLLALGAFPLWLRAWRSGGNPAPGGPRGDEGSRPDGDGSGGTDPGPPPVGSR